MEALQTEAMREGERETNTRTAAFLEAALAASTDHAGVTDFLEQPSWKGFATFLYLDLIHE